MSPCCCLYFQPWNDIKEVALLLHVYRHHKLNSMLHKLIHYTQFQVITVFLFTTHNFSELSEIHDRVRYKYPK